MSASQEIITPSTLIPTTDLHPPEWHENRRLGFGSSDAPGLFNEGYSCVRRLIYDKRGVKPDYARTESELKILQRGNRLEEIVAAELQRSVREKLGYETDNVLVGPYLRRQPARISKRTPVLRTNMDRQFVRVTLEELLQLFPYFEGKIDGDPGPGYVELKTANEWAFKAYSDPSAPQILAVNIQTQHGLYVTEYRWAIIGVLQPDNFDFHFYGVLPNVEFQQQIVERAVEAWEVVSDPTADLPAPLAWGDKRCANCQWRKTCRGGEQAILQQAGKEYASLKYEEDDSLAELVADYLTAQFKAEDDQAVADIIKDKIKERIGDREAVSVPSAGARIIFKQQAGRKMFDTKGLEADLPTIARKVAFAEYVESKAPEFVAEFTKGVTGKLITVQDLVAHYKKQSQPSRPFRLISV